MILGRDEDLAAVTGLLDGARAERGAATVVRGEGGVGKSALLAEAGALATGMTVLRAVGVESEAELPFASLHQVLAPGLDRLDRLPTPHAEALRGAFGMSADRDSHDRFLISLAPSACSPTSPHSVPRSTVSSTSPATRATTPPACPGTSRSTNSRRPSRCRPPPGTCARSSSAPASSQWRICIRLPSIA